MKFSFPAFGFTWIVSALITWVLWCFLALVFLSAKFDSGLVPAPVLLALALVPVSVVTFVVQGILYAVGQNLWPELPRARKQLLYFFGTPFFSLLCMWLVMQLLGGADSFIPRL